MSPSCGSASAFVAERLYMLHGNVKGEEDWQTDVDLIIVQIQTNDDVHASRAADAEAKQRQLHVTYA